MIILKNGMTRFGTPFPTLDLALLKRRGEDASLGER
jgi:hypothetical protein